MINCTIIVFREFFEISLILGIIIFAIRNINSYKRYVFVGICAGIGFSILAAILFQHLKNLFIGSSQEIINITILSLVIILMIYTVCWMEAHSKEYAQKIKNNTQYIQNGKKPLYAISIIIATSMIREGMEIILFLNGAIASGTTIIDVIYGFVLGACLGVIVGFSIYLGMFKISKKYVFITTKWLLILVCAGMASQIANLLSAANILTIGSITLWNSEWLISDHSILGKTLKALIGYSSNPTLMEVIFFFSVIIIIIIIQKLYYNHNSKLSKI